MYNTPVAPGNTLFMLVLVSYDVIGNDIYSKYYVYIYKKSVQGISYVM